MLLGRTGRRTGRLARSVPISKPLFICKALSTTAGGKTQLSHNGGTYSAIQQNEFTPNPKTTILVHNIPVGLTQDKFRELLKGVNVRKPDLQPGCSFHVRNEAEAEVLATYVATKCDMTANITNTSLPSVFLENLSKDLSIEALESSFKKLNAHSIHLIGGSTFHVHMATADDAIRAAKLIGSIRVGNSEVKTSITKLPSGQFSVNVFNIHPSEDDTKVEGIILSALSEDTELNNYIPSTSKSAANKSTLRLRFASLTSDERLAEIRQSLKTVKFAQGKFAVSEVKDVMKPALFVRNFKHVMKGLSSIEKLFEGHGAERFQAIGSDTTNDLTNANFMVVYFGSEAAALKSLSKLKGLKMDGKLLNISYREVSEPAVLLENLPKGISAAEVSTQLMDRNVCGNILDRFSTLAVGAKLYPPIVHGETATVVLSSPEEARLVAAAATRLKFPQHNQLITTQRIEIHDKGFEVSLPVGVTEEEAVQALNTLGLPDVKEVTYQSGTSAFVAFTTLNEANVALTSVINGSVSLSAEKTDDSESKSNSKQVLSRLSLTPAYVVQVAGMDPAAPISDLIQRIQDDSVLQGAEPMRVDRSGLMRFKRQRDVVPGLKQLKTLPWSEFGWQEGENVKIERYRPLVSSGDTGYDGDEKGDKFDLFNTFSVKLLLKDYLHTDPATRYQVAMNAFERSLNDAMMKLDDPETLMDESVNPEVLKHVKVLLGKRRKHTDKFDKEARDNVDKELFKIFLQREDMHRFAADFKEMEAYLGPAEPNNLYNWSKFTLHTEFDLAALKEGMQTQIEDMERKRLDALVQKLNSAKGGGMVATTREEQKLAKKMADQNDEDGGLMALVDAQKGKKDNPAVIVTTEDEDDEKVQISLEDPAILQDQDGFCWSGVILNTDMVQHTMAGGRVLSHRALVCVGNLKGAAGFGMGKGKTGQDAVTGAFRAALRNLVHIDLYDNYGLAHDLHGKHNSCHCYIRATPRGRDIVSSTFAEEVLVRFGIGSASCKLVGRRDPYAQINAIFDAIRKHENIDETAKERGVRYLTLRWAFENNV